MRPLDEGRPKSPGKEPGFSSAVNELARLDQALTDLKACESAEVVLVRCEVPAQERFLGERLVGRARRLGFATAMISLREHGLEALDRVVRQLVERIEPPERSGERGLTGLVAGFARRLGPAAEKRFETRVRRWGAAGDLTALSRAFLQDHEEAARTLEAWLDGTELGRAGGCPGVRGALTERSARRSLVELTRIVRALGHSGCFFCLVDGDMLARRTPRQSQRAYTVLRELIDNFDSGRGMVSTRLLLAGSDRLFEGPRSLRSLPALASRLDSPSGAIPPPPHRSWTRLHAGQGGRVKTRPVRPTNPRLPTLRTLIRVAQGLPPTDAVASMSVGHEQIDASITRLLEHARMAGSVFSVVHGDYGSGKTHLLLHLAERARRAGHPVFRLDLERLNFDLGNPARHLHRLLDESELPAPRRPSALEWLEVTTRDARGMQRLMRTVRRIAVESSEAAAVARRVLRSCDRAPDPSRVVEAFLGARDLVEKPGTAAHRRDAYGRLLLWIDLLQRLEGLRGPVLLIDEAENLYSPGVTRAARRTALRSLAFYCGGALPSTCVVMTTTPRAFGKLKYEARELLYDVSVQSSALDWEDANMLLYRLLRLEPQRVPALTGEQRAELAQRVVSAHREVRAFEASVDIDAVVAREEPPRRMIRRLVDELEASWWELRTIATPDSSRPPLATADSVQELREPSPATPGLVPRTGVVGRTIDRG